MSNPASTPAPACAKALPRVPTFHGVDAETAVADALDPIAVWSDAVLAAALLAVDPVGLGGVDLRCLPGPVRDAWLGRLKAILPTETPVRRVPLGIPDERLLGGLDLAATLAAGRPVVERGLLAEVGGMDQPGVVLLAMAERLAPGTAGRLSAAIDRRAVRVERDGLAHGAPCRIALIALNEGLAQDERPPEALLDRLAFPIDLHAIPPRLPAEVGNGAPSVDRVRVAMAQQILGTVVVPDDLLQGLCATALTLGVLSLRPSMQAMRAACAAAALAGRNTVGTDDAGLAVRLVLAPRATVWPSVEPPDDLPKHDPPPECREETDQQRPDPPQQPDGSMEDMLLAAAAAALPPDLLARLRAAAGPARGRQTAGKAGRRRPDGVRGRPAGMRRGPPDRSARLNLVETLRAAAPWQPLRRTRFQDRVQVRRDDFRVTRIKQRSRTVTIFLVDASGSSALHRLAEAKGAVELLLADCYVRRDAVALIAFRGLGAELLLPPTRSLVRAKRSLAGLPGGGGTPLAAGLDAAAALAEAVERKGSTPFLVVLTDGRANVARPRPLDAAESRLPGREAAMADAEDAARSLRAAGVASVLIDTAPRPQIRARDLAANLGARYVPMPHADALVLSQIAGGSTAGRWD